MRQRNRIRKLPTPKPATDAVMPAKKPTTITRNSNNGTPKLNKQMEWLKSF